MGNKTSIMIHDRDTNIVFLSKWLREAHPQFFERFTALMSEVGVRWEILKYTNDYWVRDFMPIQLEDGVFVKYRYRPDYLLRSAEDRATITNCSRACKCLGIKCRETDIVLDGGNVVPCGDFVVMTNKIFAENGRPMNDAALLSELRDVFGREVIIIPWHKTDDDEYGHADGLIKYIGGNQILMGNHRDSQPEEATAIRRELERHGFEVTELKFNVPRPRKTLNWAYINFLQVGDVIILPTFGIAEDRQARDQIQAAFPDCIIFGLRTNEIAPEGGALHCLTWNVKL